MLPRRTDRIRGVIASASLKQVARRAELRRGHRIRGVIASASLKPSNPTLGSSFIQSYPRRYCLGLIEARVPARAGRRAALYPRRYCLGLIEAANTGT